jgi:allophanate hydrolase
MSNAVTFHGAGPAVTVQDMGRPGQMAQGLSRGGALDRVALLEATALLGLTTVQPAFEMAGMGGGFSVAAPSRFALTGAPMQASIDGTPIGWHQSHSLLPGQILKIGSLRAGAYGYLTFGGGLEAPELFGSRATHLSIGLGQVLKRGDCLRLGADPQPDNAGLVLDADDRFRGGEIRIIRGPQTDLFPRAVLERFLGTPFSRSVQANRQAVRLDYNGPGFTSDQAGGLASDFIMPGDIQMTGEGIPFVLMAECQTVGGYPRIGTVFAPDLPRLVQAPVNADIRFRLLEFDQADQQFKPEAEILRQLRGRVRPAVRDPKDIPDLLGYQLISGVTAGDDLERTTE